MAGKLIMQNQGQKFSGAREVTTNQNGVFEHLEALVLRYVHTEFRRPFAEHTVAAFAEADAFVRAVGRPVVLDSGCGTGRSSFALAARFPDAVVVAVDKSQVRLTKAALQNSETSKLAERILFVRAELLDFWRLALEAGWNIQHHAVFYPNPWPKASEATRRFHLSPVFPALLKLAPSMELRTNWKIYAEEFAMAAQIACCELQMKCDVRLSEFVPEVPETAFEEKYADAGQKLWKVVYAKI